MEYFKKTSPESVGIDSDGILAFLKDIRRKGIELHSLMIVRHGQCCAAGWWKPYGPEFLHPLYSFSKSLTATAIGFAEQEGLLSLDEHLTDLFPDELPEKVPDNLKEVTIHHLLCMSCGQETENTDKGPGWIRSFLAHPFPHKPGTFYKYNTTGTNMLAAVLKKKTGQNVTEFLRPRLLEPLGISRITCHKLADPDSVEMGGAGMKLATEDMARFTYFMLQKGKWEGRQLLNENWFARATSRQMETAGDSEGHVKEWARGYGYQCWMGSLPDSFRADGAYGQFGFVYPSLDLFVITTAATEQTQSLIDSMMDYFIPSVKEKELPASGKAEILSHCLAHLHLPALSSCRNPEMENKISSVVWAADKDAPCSSMEILIGGIGLFDIREENLDHMKFSFEGDTVTWTCLENSQEKKITASLADTFLLTECEGHTYAATARWRCYEVLEMEVRRMDALSGVRLLFRFGEDTLTIEADDTLIAAWGLGRLPRNLSPLHAEI